LFPAKKRTQLGFVNLLQKFNDNIKYLHEQLSYRNFSSEMLIFAIKHIDLYVNNTVE